MNKPGKRNIEGTLEAFIWILLVVDITLLILHVLFGWSIINLDEEGNLSAWYSSVKLLILSALCLRIFNRERNSRQAAPKFKLIWLWLLVGLIFLMLSADETASMHERTARYIMQQSSVGLDIREGVLGGDEGKDSFAWVILLAPFILSVTVLFALFFHNRLKISPPAYWLAAGALLLFLLAICMESTIYFFPSFSDWSSSHVGLYRFFIGIEESGELLGATLFISALGRYNRLLRHKL